MNAETRLRELVEAGEVSLTRLYSPDEIREFAGRIGVSTFYVVSILRKLRREAARAGK